VPHPSRLHSACATKLVVCYLQSWARAARHTHTTRERRHSTLLNTGRDSAMSTSRTQGDEHELPATVRRWYALARPDWFVGLQNREMVSVFLPQSCMPPTARQPPCFVRRSARCLPTNRSSYPRDPMTFMQLNSSPWFPRRCLSHASNGSRYEI
jgi:hypothetical protein